MHWLHSGFIMCRRFLSVCPMMVHCTFHHRLFCIQDHTHASLSLLSLPFHLRPNPFLAVVPRSVNRKSGRTFMEYLDNRLGVDSRRPQFSDPPHPFTFCTLFSSFLLYSSGKACGFIHPTANISSRCVVVVVVLAVLCEGAPRKIKANTMSSKVGGGALWQVLLRSLSREAVEFGGKNLLTMEEPFCCLDDVESVGKRMLIYSTGRNTYHLVLPSRFFLHVSICQAFFSPESLYSLYSPSGGIKVRGIHSIPTIQREIR